MSVTVKNNLDLVKDNHYDIVVHVGCLTDMLGDKMNISVNDFSECSDFISEVKSVKRSFLVITNTEDQALSILSWLDERSLSIHPRIISTVDVVPFALMDGEICVGLQKREMHPYKNQYALPGQFIHLNEDHNTDDTVNRVKNKFLTQNVYCEQVHTIAGANRDIRGPNGWAMSVIYMGLIPLNDIERIQQNNIEFFSINSLPDNISFDHKDLIQIAYQRLVDKSSYSNYPMFMMDNAFSLSDLIKAYEDIVLHTFDQSSFRRKIKEKDILEEVGRGKGKGSPILMKNKKGAVIFDKSIV